MAGLENAAYRATFTAQALATMGVDALWDRCVTTFLTWDARARVYEEFGGGAQRREAIERDRYALEHKFGKGWCDHPDAQDDFARITAAEQVDDDALASRFYEPFWQSLRDMVLTPAPTLAAALLKACVAEIHEVWNDASMEGDCGAIIDAELARFAGGLV